ncbi:MAG: pyridoxal-phosphate dependent enzyme [Planctomycetota bacterium]
MNTFPTFQEIQMAMQRIQKFVYRTPVLTCQHINERVEAEVFFKCENFQKVGAFKFRGACNAVFSLDNASSGVATHSSGNHAQALARAAQIRQIPAYIVMPNNAPSVKKNAVAGYGAQITFCAPTLESREKTLELLVSQTGAHLIHPYNDFSVIAGQGTAALELLQEVPHLEIIMTPVGGGGLLSGTALATKGIDPRIQVYAAEPEQADDAYRSLQAGKILPAENPQTIADGLRSSLGTLTFPIIQKHVAGIIRVSEKEIVEAMYSIWERMKIIIEPSSALPLGALLQKKSQFIGKRIGIILSGGNLDFVQFPWSHYLST